MRMLLLCISVTCMAHPVLAQNAFIGYDYLTSSTARPWSGVDELFNAGTSSAVNIKGSAPAQVKSARICNENNIQHYELGGTSHYVEITLQPEAYNSTIQFEFTGSGNSTTADNAKMGVVYSDKVPFDFNSIVGGVETEFFPTTNSDWKVIALANAPAGTKSARLYRRVYYWTADNKASEGSGSSSGRVQLGLGQTIRLASLNIKFTPAGDAPKVITTGITNLTAHSTKVISEVTDKGSAEVSERGIGWDTSDNFTINDATKIVSGSGIGVYETTIAGLLPNTLYGVLSYAKSTVNTTVTKIDTFVTLHNTPVVNAATNVNVTSATVNVDVENSGHYLYEYEVLVDNDADFSSPVSQASLSSTSDGTLNLMTLIANTTYYVKTRIKGVGGVTEWSNTYSFKTFGNDPRIWSDPVSIDFDTLSTGLRSVEKRIVIRGTNLNPVNDGISLYANEYFDIREDGKSAYVKFLGKDDINGTIDSLVVWISYNFISGGLSGQYKDTLKIGSTGLDTLRVPLEAYVLDSASVTVTSNNPQSSTIGGGTLNNSIFHFDVQNQENRYTALLKKADFNLSGSFATNEITKLQLKYSSTDNASEAIEVSTAIVNPANGTVSFDNIGKQLKAGEKGYFWLLVDVAGNAAIGNTVKAGLTKFSLSHGHTSYSISDGNVFTFSANTNENDHFRVKNIIANNTDISTWESSADSTNWHVATALPTTNAKSIVINNGQTLEINTLTFPYGGKVTYKENATLKVSGTYTSNLQFDAGNYYNIVWDANINGTNYISFGDKAVVVKNRLTIEKTGDGALLTSAGVTSNLMVDSLELKSGNVFVNRNSGSVRSMTVNKYAYIGNGGTLFIKTVGGNGAGNLYLNGDLVIEQNGKIEKNTANSTSNILFSNNNNQNITVNGIIKGMSATDLQFEINKYQNAEIILKSNVDLSLVALKLVKGFLTIGNYNLKLTKQAAGYNDSAFIVTNGTGVVKTPLSAGDTSMFLVGPNKLSCNALVIKNTGETDEFSVNVQEGFEGLSLNDVTSAVNRVWHIDEAVKGGNSVNLVFYYKESHVNQNYPPGTVYYVGHFLNGNWETTVFTPELQTADLWIGRLNNVTTFSPFALGTNNAFNNALPLKLTATNAININNGVKISWTTTAEIDIAYYEVERSVNGQDFVTIGHRVAPKQSVGQLNNDYELTDEQALVKAYYRIKIVNKDGSITYSKLMYLQIQLNKDFSVVPNPAKSNIYLNFKPLTGKGSVRIVDLSGKIVRNVSLGNSVSNINIDISALSAGTYQVILIDEQTNLTSRFIKL